MRFRKFIKVEPESIVKVREAVLAAHESDKESFDDNDIKKMVSSDWTCFRFLAFVNGDVDGATNALIDSLKWRKSKNFNSFTTHYPYPDLFFRMGTVFTYEPDKWGHQTLYVRVKYLRKIGELKPLLSDLVDYILWKTDEASGESGWILIMDFDGAGLVNADIDTLSKMISTLKTHFPCGLDFILVVDLPWILKGFWALVKTWVGSSDSLIKFVSRKSISDYFEPSNVPDFMGGNCKLPYCGDHVVKSLGISDKCPDLFSYCHDTLKLSDRRCSEIESIYQPYLDQSMQKIIE